jgi:hypothetical protein
MALQAQKESNADIISDILLRSKVGNSAYFLFEDSTYNNV